MNTLQKPRPSSALTAPVAAGMAPPPHAELIDRSHQRCNAFGLKRIDRPDYSPMLRADLQVARERNRRLYTHAAPVMEMLREQIAETESMIVLTDAQGTILHAVGDNDFLERAGKVALSPGVNWAEHAKGTNAIGTTLFEEQPTLVHAGQHFMHANHFLTCSAAPIFDPRGDILGVLDVSGDQRSFHRHTMGLVRVSARMIENHWLSDDCSDRLRLHFHSRPEFIGTLLEGIVVIGEGGKILGANRSALDQLALSGVSLRGHTLTTLFGTTVPALADHFRSPLPMPLQLDAPGGAKFHVMARANWRAPSCFGGYTASQDEPGQGPSAGHAGTMSAGGSQAPAPGMSAARASQPPAGLAYLQTGDAQVENVVRKLRRVIDRDIPLLILGETGTGKEVLARAVHQESQRARQPFVAVNCASIPESLIEAELFGYEDGAFTGAKRKGSPGRIVQANGGTLFLDEIGDMPLALQARLLRVLQERSVTPLGSLRSIPVDIAVIGATHRNLREMIEQQQFREDLYYRLNGLAVRLPPLRERSDLMVVARRILQAECPHGAPEIGGTVAAMFRRYAWPGNIRQLANVLRTAAVMAGGEAQINELHLSDDFLEDVQREPVPRTAPGSAVAGSATASPAAAGPCTTTAAAAADAAAGTVARPIDGVDALATPACASIGAHPAAPPMRAEAPATLEQAERDLIRNVLASVNGNISEASKRLGVSRNTIYRKLRKDEAVAS